MKKLYTNQHRIGVKLGKFFEENGVNLIRFDYRNLGVSDGYFEQSNMKDRIKDIKEVCNYIKSCFGNIKTEIFLIGFSDGARNAILATQSIKELKGLILWNPIFNIYGNNNEMD